jgi:hypothetical protein
MAIKREHYGVTGLNATMGLLAHRCLMKAHCSCLDTHMGGRKNGRHTC